MGGGEDDGVGEGVASGVGVGEGAGEGVGDGVGDGEGADVGVGGGVGVRVMAAKTAGEAVNAAPARPFEEPLTLRTSRTISTPLSTATASTSQTVAVWYHRGGGSGGGIILVGWSSIDMAGLSRSCPAHRRGPAASIIAAGGPAAGRSYARISGRNAYGRRAAGRYTCRMSGRILVGTASWTDPSLIASGRFYPPEAKTPEDRLRFYSHIFPIVEVDSSYYSIPAERTARLWVERTPEDFTFDVKAFSLFTHHPTPPRALPKDIREALPQPALDKRNLYYDDVPPDLRDELWQRFEQTLLPLDSAGKLGVVLFQFPPWFMPGHESIAYLERLPGLLPQYTPAVEFRSPRWMDEEHIERTLGLLADRGMPYVVVDEPQGTPASVPPVVAATAPVAVVRFHGRNRAAWAKRGASIAEKYDYLYTPEELQSWLPGLRRLADETREVHVLMNNCREDKAVVGARQLIALLGGADPASLSSPSAHL